MFGAKAQIAILEKEVAAEVVMVSFDRLMGLQASPDAPIAIAARAAASQCYREMEKQLHV